MYEILHAQAPQEELDFYLSYARPGDAILEALCGSGRFFLPFFERGFDIQGMDASPDMLAKLRKKCPNAPAVCADIAAYTPDRAYDYIFISSGSVSLFTDLALCRRILAQLKSWLAPGGKLVFAVETVADRCPDDTDYREAVAVPMQGGHRIVLRTKNHYDPATQTQYAPGSMSSMQGMTCWNGNSWISKRTSTVSARWRRSLPGWTLPPCTPMSRSTSILLWTIPAKCSCSNAASKALPHQKKTSRRMSFLCLSFVALRRLGHERRRSENAAMRRIDILSMIEPGERLREHVF